MLFHLKNHSLWFAVTIGLSLLCLAPKHVNCDETSDGVYNPAPVGVDDLNLQIDEEKSAGGKASINEGAKDKNYDSPRVKSEGLYLFDSFDDMVQFKTNWVQSKDPKYNGVWQLNSGPDRPRADLQLVMPEKARHYGLSAKLAKPFKFTEDKPLIIQYEVQFREGLDCGGAYVKLLKNSAISDLTKLTDKTPFTIMFGPDKCGSESKLHFIVQYLNPKTQEYSEKHWKQSKYISNLLATFTDKKHHLFRLVLEPNSSFEMFVDDKSVGKGSLLDDMDPPINPPKEIVDLTDKKPDDWDERPKIDDPDAKKPDDWDEDAPKTIEDPNAKKPDDWLENEPKNIPDPTASKPDDWEEMDGEWEAPLIENPACAKVSGCGEWEAPHVPNPAYKGKWKPPKIDNPNYKGKWTPRMIQNPDYFYDEKPFSSLDSIGAVAYELWTMGENVAFDNMIITSNIDSADLVQSITWQSKKAEADASSPSLLTRTIYHLNAQPWLWAVFALVIALPLWLFISYCCDTKKNRRQPAEESAGPIKTEESKQDGEASTSRGPHDVTPDESSEEVPEEEDDEDLSDEKDDDDDQKKSAGDEDPPKRQIRQRKIK